jgi:hypothetical protein
VDESGHSGDTGAADSGDGADAHERIRVNGWATPDSPWSNAGAALESEGDVPAWRRPTSSEARPLPRSLERPFGGRPIPTQPSAVHPASPAPVPAPTPPGFIDAKQAGEIPPSGEGEAPRWGENRSRYADLLAPLAPERPGPVRSDPVRSDPGLNAGGRFGSPSVPVNHPAPMRGFDVPTPNSAPPYPYEGDLDDVGRTSAPPVSPQRTTAAVPLVRPAAPGGRRPDWIATDLGHEQARHALSQGTPIQGSPTLGTPPRSNPPLGNPSLGNPPLSNPSLGNPSLGNPSLGGPAVGSAGVGSPAVGGAGFGSTEVGGAGVGGTGFGSPAAPVHGSPIPAPQPRTETQADKPVAGETNPARPSYDPSSFPRRLGYEPAPAAESSGYTPPPAYSGFGGRGADPVRPGDPGGPRAADPGDQGTRVLLPQRVPAQPDVPRVPEPPLVEPTAETPALARIATHLRRGDLLPAQDRQEGFDVQAILAAVREVAGVRDASLRTTPAGAHSLRLDLAEGADPAEVSRRVARLLQDRMGLDAAMKGEAPTAPVSPARPAPVSPGRPAPVSPGRPAPVSPGRPAPEPLRESVSREIPRATGPVSAPPFRPEPARVEPTRSEALRPETLRPETGRPETLRPEALRPETGRPETLRPEALRPETGRPEMLRPETLLPETLRPETGRPQTLRPETGRPETLRPETARPETLRSEIGRPETPRPETVRSAVVRETRVEKAAQHERADDVLHEELVTETAMVPTGVEARPPRPLYPAHDPGPRVVIENVQVNTFGTDATVEVRLGVGGRSAAGEASGPAVDGYLLRLCALATAAAVDQLLSGADHADGPVRCFVEHAAAVPFGASQVAVAVLLLSCGGWVEQLAGSAVVTGDDRLAMVRATLAAVNRRLEALLSG